jgi:hypothetical protein
MIVAYRLSAGIAGLGLGFYWLWLWLHDGQSMTLLAALGLLSGGALSLSFAWSWKRIVERRTSVSRPRIEDPSKGLEGAGWGQRQRR